MATTGRKKSTAAKRRKPGASKRKRKARVGAAASPSTISISGIGRFKKSSCHKNKTEAKKAAESKRARGAKARVLKSGTGYCVYSRGRAAKRA